MGAQQVGGGAAMEDWLTRIWTDLLGRTTGPLTLRLILQPAMAIIFAFRDGRKDAREGLPPHFYGFFTDPANRRERMREGLKSMGRVLVMAVVMDVIYQLIVFRWVYPVEVLLVAFILAILPYLLLRGPFNRLARLRRRGEPAAERDSEQV